MRKKILVVTGTRAEYGLFKNFLHEVCEDDDLILQLVVSCMHLSSEFGLTYRLIEQDGFKIDAKVEMLLSSDTGVGVAKSVGVGVLGFADAFDRLKPDIIVLLGDRFEILAAAQAALFLKIPIAHIHGGELSAGAIDDNIRHCITKMAHLHFTAAEPYRNRVIQMGERPDFVFNTGSPGIERIRKWNCLSRQTLEKDLNFAFGQPTFLITYHPETLDINGVNTDCTELLAALDAFPNATLLFTEANADEGGKLINQLIDEYANLRADHTHIFTTMGDENYISVMRCVDVLIGNSSSAIIEAPAIPKASVNIGKRQDGRLRADSIIDCGSDRHEISTAIQKALSPGFQNIVKNTVSPYDHGDSAKNIKNAIKKIDLRKLPRKIFYDIPLSVEAVNEQ
ncbi:MAG: UDP-N-acetyl-D-glucosamine 2-epimerase, UDP-hydrolysing [Gammaproteobacteria bacterium RIFCSPHIGHO2_12_FULL_38_14]|nr:MAG: UDP-N-acetyl-D-glucosamine 2-epimerase, UDP-hydrolysing [Gammaproteobacteria bacterium RIFCSPHIGHO2_12_FULL_38_14]